MERPVSVAPFPPTASPPAGYGFAQFENGRPLSAGTWALSSEEACVALHRARELLGVAVLRGFDHFGHLVLGRANEGESSADVLRMGGGPSKRVEGAVERPGRGQ